MIRRGEEAAAALRAHHLPGRRHADGLARRAPGRGAGLRWERRSRCCPARRVTCEANRAMADAPLRGLAESGVNRLSMGVQSFDDAELRWLGRIHDAGQAEAAFEAVRRADSPTSTWASSSGCPARNSHARSARWRAPWPWGPSTSPTASRSSTARRSTTTCAWAARSCRRRPGQDCHELALDRLAQAGYEQYEISNWQRGDHAQAPQPAYWRHEPYLGARRGREQFRRRAALVERPPVPEYVAQWGTASLRCATARRSTPAWRWGSLAMPACARWRRGRACGAGGASARGSAHRCPRRGRRPRGAVACWSACPTGCASLRGPPVGQPGLCRVSGGE